MVKHGAKEFVSKGASTNSVESDRAVSEGGYTGVSHHRSKKHMRRYVNEYVSLLSEGNGRNYTVARLAHIVRNGVGKRLANGALTQ